MMLSIVGAGPGSEKNMTMEAVEYLERAERVIFSPEVAHLITPTSHWLAKAQQYSTPQALLEASWGVRLVWLVPGTPAFYPPVQSILPLLVDQSQSPLHIVSGVPVITARLEREGLFLPAHRLVFEDVTGEPLLWENNESEEFMGPWRARRIVFGALRPLEGRKIILLRDGPRAQRAIRWLQDWGAQARAYPVSRLADPPSYDAVDEALRRAERYEWLVLTSGEAVDRWFGRMRHLGMDVRCLKAKIAVIGPETAARVREHGLVPELMPDGDYSQEGLAAAFSDRPVRGRPVIFPGGQLNRSYLGEILRGRGALVDEVLLYRNQPEPLAPAFHQAIREGAIDAILYSASSQVEYLANQLPGEDRNALQNILAFSIGPLTTRTLAHYGMRVAAESSEPSLRLLVETVNQYFAKGDHHVPD